MAIVGRDSGADIVLPYPQVSARHACVEALGAGRLRVRDLGSANGTYVGGRRVETAEIRVGDDLRFGTIPMDWPAARSVLDAEARLGVGFILGRDPTCNIVLNDSRVSGRHLRVIPEGAQFRVLDLGSANGLTVNGRPVSHALVGSRDRVMLGSLPIDLPGVIAQHQRPSASPMLQAPPIAWTPPPVEAAPVAPPAPPSARRAWLWGVAALGVLALGAGAFLYGTRETLVRKCEVEGCTRETFHEQAFVFQVEDSRRRMQAVEPWCETHAAEPVQYKKTTFCRICGKVVSEVTLQAPRRTRPKDIEDHQGLCEDNYCKSKDAALTAVDKGSELMDKATDDLVGGAVEMLDRLIKK